MPENFFRVNLQLLKLQLPLRRSYLHLSLYFRSSHYLHSTYVMKQNDQQNNNKMIKSTKRLTSYLLDYLASDIYTRNYADFSQQAPFKFSIDSVSSAETKQWASLFFLGLCLVEVVSGKTVFDDIENDFRVLRTKVSGGKPNIPVRLTIFEPWSLQVNPIILHHKVDTTRDLIRSLF